MPNKVPLFQILQRAFSMKIKVDQIGDEGCELDEAIEPAWMLSQLGPNAMFRVSAPGTFKASLVRVEQTVHVRGRVDLVLKTECSRCLGDMTRVVDSPIDVVMLPVGVERPSTEEEVELNEDDLGISLYQNNEIDLGEIVRDEVFLQLPMTPVCRKGCAGLCDNCGANLNEGSCGCPESCDIRWNALQNVKLN